MGRWLLKSSHGIYQSAGIIEFDQGAYYGGPDGADLSSAYTYDGAYSFQQGTEPNGGGSFKLLYSCGDGCTGSSTFQLTYQSACAVAIFHEQISECTGNRIIFAGDVVLTRP